MTDEGTDDRSDRDERDDREERSSDESAIEKSDASLSLNAMLEIVAHHHRREILRTLIESSDDTATLDELMNRIARLEAERTGLEPGHDQIEMAFHHVHLPKLTDAGLVEYDPRSTAVRYRSHDRLEGLLEYLGSEESP